MNIKPLLKHPLFNILLMFSSVAFLLIFAEIAVRTYHIFNPLIIKLDTKLGWRVNPNVSFTKQATDAAGEVYTIHYAVESNGFRTFGDLNATKPKVFIIGDSFTHALEVSNEKTYFEIVAKTLPIEVFAYGCVGYSSLQEYMIIDQYIDQINPDLVVMQFSANDIINNHYDMEFHFESNNNGLRRPYLNLNGEIEYHLPKDNAFIRNAIIQYSEFLYFIMSRLDLIFLKRDNTFEAEIRKQQQRHPVYQEAAQVTDLIFNKIKERLNGTPMHVFSVDRYQPYHDTFTELSEKHQFIIADNLNDHLNSAKKQNINIYAQDKAHWNPMGHQLCAEALIESISGLIANDQSERHSNN